MYGWSNFASILYPLEDMPDEPALDSFRLVTKGSADMGLSVKWAACNVGATRPEEYGEYYYDFKPENDPAIAELGGRWRTPTMEEFEELMTECYWEWTEYNGTSGHMIYSFKTQNRIFLPAAGCYRDGAPYCGGSYGFYWTSTKYYFYGCDYLFFQADDMEIIDGTRDYDSSFSIRPVYTPK